MNRFLRFLCSIFGHHYMVIDRASTWSIYCPNCNDLTTRCRRCGADITGQGWPWHRECPMEVLNG